MTKKLRTKNHERIGSKKLRNEKKNENYEKTGNENPEIATNEKSENNKKNEGKKGTEITRKINRFNDFYSIS